MEVLKGETIWLTRKFIIIIINSILNIEYAKFNLYEDQPESIRIRVII